MDISLMTTGQKIQKVMYCLLLIISCLEIAAGAQYSNVRIEWKQLSRQVFDDYYLISDEAFYLLTGIYSIVVLIFLFIHSFFRLKHHLCILTAFYGTLSVMCLQIASAIFSIFTLVLESESGIAIYVQKLPESVQKSSFMTLQNEMTAQVFLVFLIGLPSFAYLMYHRHSEWTETYFKVKRSSENQNESDLSYKRIN